MPTSRGWLRATAWSWTTGGVRRKRYWSLPVVEVVDLPRPGDYLDRFRELLDQAVGDRLRTSRVGIYMSGGLDSPLVAAAARRLLSERYGRFELTAFTYVYDHLIPDDERHYAGLVARALGIPIQFVAADDFGVYAEVERSAWPPPEPVGEPSWPDQASLGVCRGCRGTRVLDWLGRRRPAAGRRETALARPRAARPMAPPGLGYRRYVVRLRALPPVGLRTAPEAKREALRPESSSTAVDQPSLREAVRPLGSPSRPFSDASGTGRARDAAYANYGLPVWT